jgi:hypothetical protein
LKAPILQLNINAIPSVPKEIVQMSLILTEIRGLAVKAVLHRGVIALMETTAACLNAICRAMAGNAT